MPPCLPDHQAHCDQVSSALEFGDERPAVSVCALRHFAACQCGAAAEAAPASPKTGAGRLFHFSQHASLLSFCCKPCAAARSPQCCGLRPVLRPYKNMISPRQFRHFKLCYRAYCVSVLSHPCHPTFVRNNLQKQLLRFFEVPLQLSLGI
jgi:hypothetical protein